MLINQNVSCSCCGGTSLILMGDDEIDCPCCSVRGHRKFTEWYPRRFDAKPLREPETELQEAWSEFKKAVWHNRAALLSFIAGAWLAFLIIWSVS